MVLHGLPLMAAQRKFAIVTGFTAATASSIACTWTFTTAGLHLMAIQPHHHCACVVFLVFCTICWHPNFSVLSAQGLGHMIGSGFSLLERWRYENRIAHSKLG